MASNPLLYQLLLIALVLICLRIHVWWPDAPSPTPQTPRKPNKPRRTRSKGPKPFTGMIHKPLCDACEPGADTRPKAHGWLGRGNIRANGHPGGQSWRQLQCVSCHGYFYETHSTIFHGKRSSPELLVHVIACLAEGLGIRGTARGFAIDPNTVLGWLVEVAEHL